MILLKAWFWQLVFLFNNTHCKKQLKNEEDVEMRTVFGQMVKVERREGRGDQNEIEDATNVCLNVDSLNN